MKEYELILSESEVNLILNAVAQQPYCIVADLIEKIQKQCKNQT